MKRAVIVVLGVCLIVGGHLRAQSGAAESKYELLHTFAGTGDGSAPADGDSPAGRLLLASDGHFYGTTLFGGQYDAGTLYRLAKDGQLETLLSFDGSNGALPSGGLVEIDGELYGTTENGGPFSEGSVFRFNPQTRTLTELATFDSFAGTGGLPLGGLVVVNGSLWGTTAYGPFHEEIGAAGGFSGGTVFKVSVETGELTTVVDFTGDMGAAPISGLALAENGDLHGATLGDDLNDSGPIPGTLFKVSSETGAFELLKSFNGLDEGRWPASRPLITNDGILYGTTMQGGSFEQGVIYRFDPAANAFSVVAEFGVENAAGGFQVGLVDANGTLYGTALGGSTFGAGVVYRLDGNEIVPIHHFDGETAAVPNNTLIAVDGALYGTTEQPLGTIFRITVEEAAAPTLELSPAMATYGGATSLSATLSSSSGPVAGADVAFSLNGAAVGTAITNEEGVAVLNDISIAALNAGQYAGAIHAAAANMPGAEAFGDLTVLKAVPTVTIVAGTFVYDTEPHPASASVTGVNGDDLGAAAITYNGSISAPIEPADYTVAAAFAGSANYEEAIGSAILTILPPQPGVTGLVAAYGFNEGSGNIAGDSSGRGLHGVIKGAGYGAGRFGRALMFDGTNDWVTISDAAGLDLRNGLTIEAWVNPAKLTGWRTIAIKERSEWSSAYALYASNDAARPAGYVNIAGESKGIAGPSSLPINTWSHVAVTYSGTTMRLYINGVEVNRRSVTGRLVASGGPLRIGGNSMWGEYFSGLIDEVRVYGSAITPADIVRDMNMPIAHEAEPPTVNIVSPLNGDVLSGKPLVTVAASDNVAVASVQIEVDGRPLTRSLAEAPYTQRIDVANGTHQIRAIARDTAGNVTISAPVSIRIANRRVADYQFNEPSGRDVIDNSGLGNHGKLSLAGVTRAVDAQRGTVLQFSGFGGLVSVPDADSLDLTSGMTIEAWVKPAALLGWRTIVSKEGNDGAYALYATDLGPWPAGYVRINSTVEAVRWFRTLPLGEWSHIAMTYDGETMRLFVNGEEKESRPQTGPAMITNGQLSIGGNTAWGQWFKGQMDDVRIYDVAIGEAQITADLKEKQPQ